MMDYYIIIKMINMVFMKKLRKCLQYNVLKSVGQRKGVVYYDSVHVKTIFM